MNKIIKSSMLKFKNQKDALLAIWSSGNAFVSGSGGSNLGQVKSDTVLPTTRHRYKFEKSCVAHRRNDADMGLANSLPTSA